MRSKPATPSTPRPFNNPKIKNNLINPDTDAQIQRLQAQTVELQAQLKEARHKQEEERRRKALYAKLEAAPQSDEVVIAYRIWHVIKPESDVPRLTSLMSEHIWEPYEAMYASQNDIEQLLTDPNTKRGVHAYGNMYYASAEFRASRNATVLGAVSLWGVVNYYEVPNRSLINGYRAQYAYPHSLIAYRPLVSSDPDYSPSKVYTYGGEYTGIIRHLANVYQVPIDINATPDNIYSNESYWRDSYRSYK